MDIDDEFYQDGSVRFSRRRGDFNNAQWLGEDPDPNVNDRQIAEAADEPRNERDFSGWLFLGAGLVVVLCSAVILVRAAIYAGVW